MYTVNRLICNSWHSYLLSTSFLRLYTLHLGYLLAPSTGTAVGDVWKSLGAYCESAGWAPHALSYPSPLFMLKEIKVTGPSETAQGKTQSFNGFWQRKGALSGRSQTFYLTGVCPMGPLVRVLRGHVFTWTFQEWLWHTGQVEIE